MKYFYRIHFNNGETGDFTGKDLVGKNLSAFDRFSITDEFKVYIEKGCKLKEMGPGDVKYIGIVCKKDKGDSIEYNLIDANPYFYDIFDNLSEKEVWEYGSYKTTREVISTESNAYQDIRDYLLEELRHNSKEYLESVYKTKGRFKDVLTKYADSYSSNELGEEEYHNTYELETTIRHHLTIYPIFRSVATKRYIYEKFAPYKNEVVKKKPIELSKEEKAMHDKMIEEYYNKKDALRNKVDEYNEKYDEFIEPNEYQQMNGHTGDKVR